MEDNYEISAGLDGDDFIKNRMTFLITRQNCRMYAKCSFTPEINRDLQMRLCLYKSFKIFDDMFLNRKSMKVNFNGKIHFGVFMI